MQELQELRRRIERCNDEIERIGLTKVYDKLLIELWQSDEITLVQMQSMSLPVSLKLKFQT